MSALRASSTRILVMAGGTGGHVFPALAVAERLRQDGAEVSWLGTRRGLEAKLVPPTGIPVDWITITGLRGKGFLDWLLAPMKLTLALGQGLRVVLRRRPHAVLGMGGFVTGPGGVAAWLLRKPLVIHEQNAVAGLTNRLLARIADRVLEAFPQTFTDRFQPVLTGNPVRPDIAHLPEPRQRFAGRTGPLRLLVIGGSQGAQALNNVVPEALSRLPVETRPQVWHQAGARNLGAAEQTYRGTGVTARVEPFIEDMAEAYAWADVVLCRSGALTVAELAAAGVGSILVPYPHAADDHQTRNGRWLVDAGAAELIPQDHLSAEGLATLLEPLAADRARLLAMAEAARCLALPDAARRVADLCVAAAHGDRSVEATER